MSQSVEQFDIVVVGAGLVGATLAALLGQTTTLNIALVDGGPEPAQPLSERFDPRVVALTRHSQNLFERLGIWAAMAKGANRQHLACPYTHMHVWDGEGTATIDFDGRDLHQENLGFIVENSLLINHLVKAIGVLPRVELCWTDGVSSLETTAFNDLPTTTLQLQSGRRLRAPLVLAADGANSKIRQLAQFDTREWAYGQKAIVTTVKTEQAHQYTAWQRFMSTGPLAFLPLLTVDGDEHYSSIVWSLDEDLADEIAGLEDAAFREALTQAFESKLGAVVWTDKRFSFPLRQRHAKSYVRPGIALLGDAAHTIHPLAGQGVNLGLLDVDCLVAEIDRALERRIPLGDYSILRRYQRARLGPNLAMMGLMEGFKQLFGSGSAWLNLLRNTGMTAVGQQPLLRKVLTKRAMGL